MDGRNMVVGRLVMVVRVLAALGLLGVMLAVAVGAFPLGVAVGWRVVSGGWWLDGLASGPVPVWRVAAGIVAGALTFRFGLAVRLTLVRAWADERASWEV